MESELRVCPFFRKGDVANRIYPPAVCALSGKGVIVMDDDSLRRPGSCPIIQATTPACQLKKGAEGWIPEPSNGPVLIG